MANHEPELLAEGVGMIAAGHSVRWVANTIGIPKSTLSDAYLRHLGPDAPDRETERKQANERILARAAAVAESTLANMAQRLERGDVDDKTLTAWHSVSAQSLGKLNSWERGIGGDAPTDRFASVIERVLAAGGGTLSVAITPHEPAAEFIDVTGSTDTLGSDTASDTQD